VRVRTFFVGSTVLVGWVAYGCGGESVGHLENGRAGAASSGKGGAGSTGGTSQSGRGGRGGTQAGRGGSVARGASGEPNGAADGGASTVGGTAAGRAGRGAGRGGTGDAPGGAGSGSTPESCEMSSGSGGEAVHDPCCVGDAYGDSFEYYASAAQACGEPRVCKVTIPGWLRCQDTAPAAQGRARCCSDGRWHLVAGNQQYDADYNYSGESQLSPPCGGTVVPSSHALHLDGASYLELPLTYAADDVIFELWFRTSAASGPLLGSVATPHRLYLSEGKLCFRASEGDSPLCTAQSTFADGAWHHAALSTGTADSTPYGGLYADGTLRVASEAEYYTAIDHLRAGYGPLDDPNIATYFVGDLDEIRIWGDERHPYDILDFYATRLTGERTMAKLRGYFPLEESGTATTTQNLALDITYGCDGVPEEGAGGSGPELPNATLVGFSSATSPWIEPGAF